MKNNKRNELEIINNNNIIAGYSLILDRIIISNDVFNPNISEELRSLIIDHEIKHQKYYKSYGFFKGIHINAKLEYTNKIKIIKNRKLSYEFIKLSKSRKSNIWLYSLIYKILIIPTIILDIFIYIQYIIYILTNNIIANIFRRLYKYLRRKK